MTKTITETPLNLEAIIRPRSAITKKNPTNSIHNFQLCCRDHRSKKATRRMLIRSLLLLNSLFTLSSITMAEEVDSIGLAECETICPSNLTDLQERFCPEEVQDETIEEVVPALRPNMVNLKFMAGYWGQFLSSAAENFSASRSDVNVEIVLVDMADMSPNIINEARSKTGLFDGFLTPPGVMGSIVEEDGWADLKPFIEETAERTQEWSDILLSYRQNIAQYQDQILMYPLDGDVFTMLYRKDVLEHFGLGVPRTWDEYSAVAKAVHGKTFKNQTLDGSCIGRVRGCAGAYWANLILSSMTQSGGTDSGHLFDSSNMRPLLGEALPQALEWMEEQVLHGAKDEFSQCIAANDQMNQGTCALTYNWGNTYVMHLNEGSVFREPGYELGVARTPGSTKVLDRDTMKLVPCDAKRCRFGTYYDDIGWVNHAPYLAFGGWSCAVNNYTTPGKKQLAMEFCEFAASQQESTSRVILNSTLPATGSDPFRSSHLDADLWIAQGHEPSSTSDYLSKIQESLTSENCVTDIRFPSSSEIYALMDNEFHDHLNATLHGEIQEDTLIKIRKDIGQRLSVGWNEIIAEFDQKASSRSSTLLQYQKLRNVYIVETDLNQLGKGIRAYGWGVAGLVLLSAFVCGIWTYRSRASAVVRTSQPFFLILISVGVFVFGSSIIPMTIDDGNFSVEACSKACMAIPWLTSMGWSILFSALYAKIRRVNLVVANIINFKKGQVTERDVMMPFAVLFTSNLILLLLWSLLDPLFWKRVEVSPTESYGICSADADSVVWKIVLGLLGVLNGLALVGANVEAWKARRIDTEYGESSYIGLIMASILQVVLVGVPLIFLVQDNPTARFFVNSSMAFVVSMSVLSLLFLPKILSWYETRNNPAGRLNSLKRKSAATEAAVMHDLKSKVSTLEHLLVESGIDASQYLREAGLHTFTSSGGGGGRVVPSSIEEEKESNLVGGLGVVLEEKDESFSSSPPEQAPLETGENNRRPKPINGRSSVSFWTNSTDESGSG